MTLIPSSSYSQFGFNLYKNSLYYSKIAFGNNNLDNIIVSPFFLAFHTLFDKENETLHFYPEKRDFLEDYLDLFTIISVTLIIILLIVLLGLKRIENYLQANIII